MTTEQTTFMDGYMPEDRDFTSNEEIIKIAEMFKLEGKTREELTAIRNEVVTYFHNLFEQHDNNYAWDKMTALQSMTAVIDHFYYGHR